MSKRNALIRFQSYGSTTVALPSTATVVVVDKLAALGEVLLQHPEEATPLVAAPVVRAAAAMSPLGALKSDDVAAISNSLVREGIRAAAKTRARGGVLVRDLRVPTENNASQPQVRNPDG